MGRYVPTGKVPEEPEPPLPDASGRCLPCTPMGQWAVAVRLVPDLPVASLRPEGSVLEETEAPPKGPQAAAPREALVRSRPQRLRHRSRSRGSRDPIGRYPSFRSTSVEEGHDLQRVVGRGELLQFWWRASRCRAPRSACTRSSPCTGRGRPGEGAHQRGPRTAGGPRIEVPPRAALIPWSQKPTRNLRANDSRSSFLKFVSGHGCFLPLLDRLRGLPPVQVFRVLSLFPNVHED